jgi:hypothetical protein
MTTPVPSLLHAERPVLLPQVRQRPRHGRAAGQRQRRHGPLSGFCDRCEHPYMLTPGSPSTTTSGTGNTQAPRR